MKNIIKLRSTYLKLYPLHSFISIFSVNITFIYEVHFFIFIFKNLNII